MLQRQSVALHASCGEIGPFSLYAGYLVIHTPKHLSYFLLKNPIKEEERRDAGDFWQDAV